MMIDTSLHRLLLDNLTTATLLFDSRLHLEYMNPAAEMLLAVSGQRSHGQFIGELFNEPPEAVAALHQAVERGHPFNKREATLTSANGQTLTVDYAVTPLLKQEQTFLLLEILPRDRLLRITREEAQLSKQESTKLLVRGLAHEIKNPLGGIRGAAQLLAREIDTSLRDYTDVIIGEADRLRNLLDRMLGSNRLPSLTRANIHEVLERAAQLIEAESQGNIELIRDYDPSIPDLPIDCEQMIQAILNILCNAMQAIMATNPPSGSGHIILRTRTSRQFTIAHTRHRLVVRIDILDNGPGIPDELQDTLFYPMVSGRAEGTGLGLAITQNIVSQHQGLIKCESQPGHTLFSIFLPLEPGAYAHEPQ